MHFGGLDLDDEGVRQRAMLGRNDQVILLGDEHFNEVDSVSQIVLARVERLLLDDLIHRSADLRPGTADGVACVALLFGMVETVASRGSSRLPSDDEIGSTISVDALLQQRVLADVPQNPGPTLLVTLPGRHVVVGLLVLQALEDLLVLPGDLDQLTTPGLAVQTASVRLAGHRLWRAESLFSRADRTSSHTHAVACRLR